MSDLDVRFRPLQRWPGVSLEPTARAFGPFKADYKDTLDKLANELRKLDARDIVIEVKLSSSDIRLDGWPRAGVTPRDPSVVISFESKYGPLRLYTDYLRKYEHNIRAIALHLERLRLSSLYGVGTRGEQYKGYAQIEAPRPMTIWEAAALIGTFNPSEDVLESPEAARKGYRNAAAANHPDKGGDPELWHKVSEAKRLLDEHHAKGQP